MAGLTALLGDTVKGKDGDVQVSSFATAGHVVGLYFSAHWCPPCRGFTPKLAEWYKTLRDGEVGSKLEIVFVSSDRSEEDFNNYYGEMPWKALPYDLRDAKAKLSKKFKVQGIPTLVFLEADTGKVLNKNGRGIVDSDAKGEKFPWRPKTLVDMLSGPGLSKTGEVDLKEAIKGKVLGVYFSAHWCGPCRSFTPKLIETYNKLKEAGKNFEIVFASSDQNDKSFEDYYKDMPWLALPFGDDRKDELDSHFEVNGIPTLVLLDENLDVISDEGRGAIMADPEGAQFPWIPPPLQELTTMNAGSLNEKKCLVYLTDAKEELIAQAQSLMQEVAEETEAATKASVGTEAELEPIMICYEGKDTGDLRKSLRSFLSLEDAAPCLVYLSIGDEHKHICSKTADLTKEDFRELVAKIRAETIETTALRE